MAVGGENVKSSDFCLEFGIVALTGSVCDATYSSVYADGLESSESESSESGHMSLFTVIFVFGWCPSLG